MFRPIVFAILFCLPSATVANDLSDCFWGGKNQETSYSPTFLPRINEITLVQYQQPSMNLGAPMPAIPVQATPETRAVDVPQAHIPTITIPHGAVGSVGQPATFPGAVAQAPPGAEIVYILPSTQPANAEICIDGQRTIPAAATQIVPPNTPGAIPATLKTVMVRRPKIEYRWSYAPIVNTTETLVHVVHPRTGRVVQSYCQEDSERSRLPWLHRREVLTYETVEAKVAVPVSLLPTTSSAVNTLVYP